MSHKLIGHVARRDEADHEGIAVCSVDFLPNASHMSHVFIYLRFYFYMSVRVYACIQYMQQVQSRLTYVTSLMHL